jgi:hypothetical protein
MFIRIIIITELLLVIIIIIIIINVCVYVHVLSFFATNVITIGNVLIFFFRRLKLTSNFLGIAIIQTVIFCILPFNYFCVLCTRANFVTGLSAVKFTRKETRNEMNWTEL